MHEPDAALPTLYDVKGIAPGLTGELTSVDWVAACAMRSGKSIIFWDTCITLAWLKDEKIWPLPVLKGMKMLQT